MKVFVYFNLHKRLFSVKALEGANKGRVIMHSANVYLSDVTFKVSQAGRQRVIREQRKNVHAGVVGRLDAAFSGTGLQVSYNPYEYDSFVIKGTDIPVLEAGAAKLACGTRPSIEVFAEYPSV